MKLENVDWDNYYEKIKGRPPRPLLRSALTLYTAESVDKPRQAIDLGCGDAFFCWKMAGNFGPSMAKLKLLIACWPKCRRIYKTIYKPMLPVLKK